MPKQIKNKQQTRGTLKKLTKDKLKKKERRTREEADKKQKRDQLKFIRFSDFELKKKSSRFHLTIDDTKIPRFKKKREKNKKQDIEQKRTGGD